MRFGPVAPDDALGAIAAHSLVAAGRQIKKGKVIDAADVAALVAAGLGEIVVARLDPDDVGEDVAAARLAARVAGAGVSLDRAFTGRVNLYARDAGLVVVDAARIDAVNAVDEAITVATLPGFAAVAAGAMVGTVKIIPYAVPERLLGAAEAIASTPTLTIAPFKVARVGLVQTQVGGTLAKVLDKTTRVTAKRLEPFGASLLAEHRVPHEPETLSAALRNTLAQGAELVLVFGASAIADRRDVIPDAIERAGGEVIHFGMPVDPGNLLLLGRIGAVPVLGAPGCARSPKENGFDWILARLVAGLEVSRADVTRLGVGGLLMEIATRPQPREEVPAPEATRPRIAGLVLAAGRSTRFGGPNKLLEPLAGKPVVRHAVEAMRGAGLSPITLVTGHMADAVAAAVDGLGAVVVHNPDFADGLSTSLAAGIAAQPADVDGVVVGLGDMPGVAPDLVGRLVDAFAPHEGRGIVVPTVAGRRGNPVLWARAYFTELTRIEGDVGARHLLGVHADVVAEVAVDGEGALVDVDTPEALAAARKAFE